MLRKTGVEKKHIRDDASFDDDLQFDPIDWTIFTYYLEGIFDISIKDEELGNLRSIENTIYFLEKTA